MDKWAIAHQRAFFPRAHKGDDMGQDKPEIITSSSQYKSGQRCKRLRWWQYEAPNGTPVRGWERVRLAIPLSTGGWCHRVAQALLTLASGGDLTRWYEELEVTDGLALSDASKVISAARRGYLEEVSARGLDAEGQSLDETTTAQEQAALLEAFGWAFERVRIPALLAEYEIVSIEREEFTLLAGDVGLQGRCDAVLRRRSDGLLFVWNLKTVSQPDDRWRAQWEVDQQLPLEALAVERRLGERVYGCLVEGFVKGPRVEAYEDTLKEVGASRREGVPLIRRQRNKLLYAYKLDANPPIQKADYDWNGTTAKGWHLFRTWEEQFPAPNTMAIDTAGRENPYIGMSPVAYWINWLPEEVVQSQFVLIEPIIRSECHVESKLRQVVAEERRLRGNRNITDGHNGAVEELDELWPQDEHSCIYPGRCPMWDMCWSDGVARDPAGSGLYQIRTPNHPEGED